MRVRDSDKHHGVVRSIKPNQWIAEGTFKEGYYHGLVKVVYNEFTLVGLFQDGSQLARLRLDENNNETERIDPNGLIRDLSAADFQRRK